MEVLGGTIRQQKSGLEQLERCLHIFLSSNKQFDMFQIEKNEADFIGYGGVSCTFGRSKVGLCSPGVIYGPMFFFSRYPLEKTKLWNLTKLLTFESWASYFLTIIAVVIFLKFSCYFGKRLGLHTSTEEIPLFPFRYIEH